MIFTGKTAEAGSDRMHYNPDHIKVFDELFHEHKTAIFRYAGFLTQNRDEAEDLFQETWLRVAKHFSKTTDIRNIKSWIFTITANLFRDSIRKKKIRRMLMMQNPASFENVSQEDETLFTRHDQLQFNVSDRVDVSMAVNQALLSLPFKQKQIFILKEIEGFKLIEISAMLNMPMGTVKSLLHRAVKRLQKSLHEFRDDAR